MADKTLDVPCQQCLVGYFGDDEDFNWHHRLLLLRGSEQKWIWLTPDGETQYVDLSSHRVVALRRAAPFPDQHLGNIYASDEMEDDGLTEYLADARALASILGFDMKGQVGESSDRLYVTDAPSEHFGEEVPSDAFGNEDVMLRRDGAGVVLIDENWVGCSRAPAGESWDDFAVRLRAGKARDPRLIGDIRDSMKARFVSFWDSLGRTSGEKLEGWPLKGERAMKEAMNSIHDAGQDSWDDHHTIWRKRSGIADKSSTACEHLLICVTLRLTQHDQLDLTTVAGCKYLARRLRQLEAATKRNPRQPDFEGLDVVLDVAVGEMGGMVLPKFDSWTGEQQKAEAVILKAGRVWREEHATTTRGLNNGNGNGGGGNNNSGNNNSKNKKDGDNPGGGGRAASPSS